MQRVKGELFLSPTDLNHFVECEHLTTLDLLAIDGERVEKEKDPQAEIIRKKGFEHEQAWLEHLRTVDKFQGREAPVVFFSMATSSGEEIPRGLEFLFSRNRFNVAISRAKALAVLVCSPRLLETRCRTVDQMRLVNRLCAFVEHAQARIPAIA